MPKAGHYVTQRHVAAAARVHQTTVSLVLRNHPSVPIETRTRVLAAVQKLGYKTHPLLAALMSTRLKLTPGLSSLVLGFLTDFESKERWKESPTAVQMHAGAYARAAELGFRVETFWLGDPAMSPSRLAGIFRARNINGLLVAPTHSPHGILTFDFAPFATVGLGVSTETSALLSVTHDHFSGMRTALQHCLAVGRRRIGVALTMDANEVVRDKWLAAQALVAHQQAGAATFVPAWLDGFSTEGLKVWLRDHRPDTLVGTFDPRLRAFLARERLRVPRDLALVSLSLAPHESDCAGVFQCSEVLGRSAVDLLVNALHHNKTGLMPRRQVLQVEGEWRNGASLPGGD